MEGEFSAKQIDEVARLRRGGGGGGGGGGAGEGGGFLTFPFGLSSRTDIFLVVRSSRTEPDDDVGDVTSFSTLDVVEMEERHFSRCAGGVT